MCKPLAAQFFATVNRNGPTPANHPDLGPCWIWTGDKTQSGYGRITVDGRKRMAQQVSWEIANGAPFPDGKLGCHRCDNPPCVNPEHIWPGSFAENAMDMVAKGRDNPWNRGKTHCGRGHEFTPENTLTLRGGKERKCRACHAPRKNKARSERVATMRASFGGARPPLPPGHGRPKLSEDDVRAVRAMHRDGSGHSEIARRFGIAATNVGRIVRRQQWANVPDMQETAS